LPIPVPESAPEKVNKAATSTILAEVPELPGCAADGANYQEAIANAEVVIKEWIETATELGRPIPGPKGRLVFV